MNFAELIIRWNQRYEQAPEDSRFNFILWPLLALGAINMWLTVATGFPFALLVVLGILVILAVRLPYILGWTQSASQPTADRTASPATFQIGGSGWVVDLNRRYEAMPEGRRFWVIPAILLIAGGINMALTIGSGFPFGILFLLVLLAVVAIRAPYVAGWFRPAPTLEPLSNRTEPVPVAHQPVPAIAADTAPAAPMPQSSPLQHEAAQTRGNNAEQSRSAPMPQADSVEHEPVRPVTEPPLPGLHATEGSRELPREGEDGEDTAE